MNPKKRFVLLVTVITVFVTFLGLPAFSQRQEFQSITAVEFKDGTIIQGKIIEMNASIVKIQKPDGTIEVRKFSDAKSFFKFGEEKAGIGETSVSAQDLAQDKHVYITLKPGIYSPQSSDLKDLDFETGFNGEIALGYRINPNFEVETGLGYFHTEAEERFSGQFYDLTIAGKAEANIEVIPIVVTLKAILPYKQLDFFALGGIGAYWVFGDLKASGTVDGFSGRVKFDDDAVIFGGHLGLGFHYNITPSIFVGAEGKYLWTSNAKLKDETPDVRLDSKFKLDGILATAVLGFRF